MKGDVLIQNVFNLFVLAIILEASIMAIFSISALQEISDSKPVKTARDVIILLVSLFLCYKVHILMIFRGTGFELPLILDSIISALVLTRMTNFIRDFFSRIRMND